MSVSARVSILFALSCMLGCAAALVNSSRYGLGLQDEIYYLEYIMHPAGYSAMVTPFGAVFHPVYVLFGGSLISLRILCLAWIMVCGGILGWYTDIYYRTVANVRAWPTLMLFGAFGSLLYYVFWALTPSYNVLANTGGALIVSGVLGWTTQARNGRCRDAVSCVLVGTGGALAFLGKAPFAAIAGATVLAFLFVIRKNRAAIVVNVALSIVVSALVVAALIKASMPIADFITRLDAGRRAIGDDWSAMAILRRTVGGAIFAPPIFYLAVLSAAAAAMLRNKLPARHRDLLAKVIVTLFVVDVVLIAWSTAFGIANGIGPFNPTFGVHVVALAILQLAYAFTLPERTFPSAVVAPLIVLILLPFLTAIGSSNPLLLQSSMSLYAVPVAGVLIAYLWFPAYLIQAAQAGWAVLIVLALSWSALAPYSHISMLAQTHPVRVPFTKDVLYVDAATAGYVAATRRIAWANELPVGTPVLDLSGVSPATAPLLGGRAPFYPWLITYLKQPSRIPNAAWLSLTPDERRRAWIIGPVHPNFLKDGSLSRMIRGRYVVAGTARFLPLRDAPVVVFWKPIDRADANGRMLSSGRM